MKNETAQKTRHAWNWRSLVSFYLLFAAIVLLVSGVVLFISPPGRVAHSTDWRFLGFNKEQWEAIHTLPGYVGTVFAVWHLILNWKAMLRYLQDRARRVYKLKAEFVVALLLTGIVWAGAALHLPPFGTVMDWGEGIKETWEQTTTLPAPPVEELGVEESNEAISLDTTLEEEHEAEASGKWGQFTVEELCEQQRIPLADGLARLDAYGLEADAATRIRNLADASGYAPSDVTNIILGLEPGTHEDEVP
jgi:hypothetical protein